MRTNLFCHHKNPSPFLPYILNILLSHSNWWGLHFVSKCILNTCACSYLHRLQPSSLTWSTFPCLWEHSQWHSNMSYYSPSFLTHDSFSYSIISLFSSHIRVGNSWPLFSQTILVGIFPTILVDLAKVTYDHHLTKSKPLPFNNMWHGWSLISTHF